MVDLALAAAVSDALRWYRARPDRDAVDAAYAAIMNAPKVGLGGQHDQFGRDRWPEFLEAVEQALSNA